MVLEIAHVEIKAGQNAEFEQQLAIAQQVLQQSEGYLKHDFHQCMEESQKYVLLIEWESLEAHTVGFRESDLFKQWRALIGPYFAAIPQVLHYDLKLQGAK